MATPPHVTIWLFIAMMITQVYAVAGEYFPEPLSDFELEPVLQRGLIALSFFGIVSFVATFSLLTFIIYRICRWYRRNGTLANFSQFILLITNLIFADMQQSLAFVIETHWLRLGANLAPSPACFAQGWFLSTGDVSSGVWILLIAIHTYVSVVYGYQMPGRLFSLCIVLVWVFIYGLATIGVSMHPNDLYVVAGAWCWINQKYDPDRLWLHYLWVFIAEFGTIIVYVATYFQIRKRLFPSILGASVQNTARFKKTVRIANYMIIYPVVYVVATLPLAAGRMAAMAGKNPSLAYYIVAGSLLTSSGYFDVVVYTLTRKVLLKDNLNTSSGSRSFNMSNVGNGYGTHTVIGAGSKNGAKVKTGPRKSRGSEEDSHSDRTGSADDLFGGLKAETTIEVTTAPAAAYHSAHLRMQGNGAGGRTQGWGDEEAEEEV